MSVILILIPLLFIAFLLIRSGKQKIPDDIESSAVTAPFYKAGMFAAGKINKNEKAKGLLLQRTAERMYLLEPGKDVRRSNMIYLVKRIALSLLFTTAALAIALVLCLKNNSEGFLKNGNILERNAAGESKYTVVLDAEIDGEVFRNEKIEVDEEKFTLKEAEDVLPEFEECLRKELLGKKNKPDRVEYDLSPVSSVDPYPFTVQWRFDSSLIDTAGMIDEDLKEPAQTVAEAEITYEDIKEYVRIPLIVYPRAMERKDALKKKLEDAVSEAAEGSRYDKEFILPSEAGGIAVRWTEKKKENALIYLFAAVVLGMLIFIAPDRDLDKKIKERDEQMMRDYPELVSKLSLYTGAGMTVRNAWKKICDEYTGRRADGEDIHFVYEEMKLAMHEMESGAGELAAYRNFSKRCRLQKYVKLVSLLEQSIKLGTADFISSLNMEADDARRDEKSDVRRRGEEAGTKLLLPMMLLLMIVMVVIIVPAFMTM
ncbi:MAG: hypothetical protein K5987_05260 [Lachnospiraceae bacterium]|nr:hypothetical protein [Lachnospiraceae bacterium]